MAQWESTKTDKLNMKVGTSLRVEAVFENDKLDGVTIRNRDNGGTVYVERLQDLVGLVEVLQDVVAKAVELNPPPVDDDIPF